MSLADDAKQRSEDADYERDLANAHRRIRRLQRDKSAVARALKDAETERDAAVKALNTYEHVAARDQRPPKWIAPKAKRKRNRGTVCLLVTDTHFDEVVRPEEIDDYNAYNREIGEKRLLRAFERTIILARDHIAGIEYDGACVMLGGDIATGYIHDELSENVDDTLADTVVHWTPRLAEGIRMIADEFGRVHVPAVPGNHDRWGKGPRAKQRAKDSVTWIIYNFLAREFKDDDRVTFQVTESADATFDLYDKTFLLTHGDQFRGGSGISGALAPLMLGHHRKTRRNRALGRPYDYMVMGHFHQSLTLPGVIVGNCLKGADEFGHVSNYVPSPPSQAFWIAVPEHGPTFETEVYVMDREDEGW